MKEVYPYRLRTDGVKKPLTGPKVAEAFNKFVPQSSSLRFDKSKMVVETVEVVDKVRPNLA